jgi:Protein of unknown function (DUF3306)
MASETEHFLARWSRLKREGGDAEPSPAPDSSSAAPAPSAGARKPADAGSPDGPLPELPPIDQLTSESDFRPFMDPRVPDALRRLALKKLYADPHFNVQDMLDDFAEDYTLLEALPAGMAGKLAHARRTLLGRDETDRIEAEERQAEAQAVAEDVPPPEESATTPPDAEAADQIADAEQPSGEPRKQNG